MRPHRGVAQSDAKKYQLVCVKMRDPDSEDEVLVTDGQAMHELKEGDEVVTHDYLPGTWWGRPRG